MADRIARTRRNAMRTNDLDFVSNLDYRNRCPRQCCKFRGFRMSNNVGDHLVSAQQATHAKLRAMIFSGELQAGQPMRQEEIARQLGVSRLPVREALYRLATEGLVELKPRRG